MKPWWLAFWLPIAAQAGAFYDFTVRPLDQTNMSLVSAAAPGALPRVTPYFVDGSKIRIGGPEAKTVYLFEDQSMYVIDHASRTVHVVNPATLNQVAAHYDQAIKQLQDLAAKAPPDERAEAEQKAADLKKASDRMQAPVQRQYRVTARLESVDGHECRIWEESENDAKRLELCVAPAAALTGGAQILNGMKMLSQFRHGSKFALGVDFGLTAWWADIDRLGGVPLLVREYKYDSVVSEVTLTGVHAGTPAASLWELPAGYPLQEGSD
jgi:hypothetical protein